MARSSGFSLVDYATQALPTGWLNRTLPGSVRVVIVDTNVLLTSLRRYMRDGRSALLGAATRGTLRIFAASHVYWEVLEKIPLVMPGWGFDAAIAATALDEQFLPWIRFVDVRGFSEPGRAAELVTDADDRPTAVLVGVLSPAVSLSRDPHLIETGFAFHDWVPPLLAGAARGEAASGLIAANAVLNLTVSMAGSAARAARRFPGPAVVAVGCGVALVGALALRTDLWHSRASLAGGARGVAEAALSRLGTLLEEMGDHGQKLDAATVTRSYPPSPPERLMRVLALEPVPRSHLELAEPLQADGFETDPETVLATLEQYPAFVRQGRWGWRVGVIATL
jgi:hypothetical protein